jgi:hypothetical protein
MANDLNSNDFNFDKNQYFFLLKKRETLRNQDISLWNENYGEYEELLSYRAILEQQFCYNRKDEYIFLIEKYLEETTGKDGDDLSGLSGLFRWEFLILWRHMISDLEIFEQEIHDQGIQKLTNFYIDPKSREFSDLIDQIRDLCEILSCYPEDTYGINSDEFRTSIEKIYFQIKQFL